MTHWPELWRKFKWHCIMLAFAVSMSILPAASLAAQSWLDPSTETWSDLASLTWNDLATETWTPDITLSWGMGTRVVTLRWTASVTPGVTYNVYTSGISGGPYSSDAIGIVGTSWDSVPLRSGQMLFYVVTAFDGSHESMNSNEVEVVIP